MGSNWLHEDSEAANTYLQTGAFKGMKGKCVSRNDFVWVNRPGWQAVKNFEVDYSHRIPGHAILKLSLNLEILENVGWTLKKPTEFPVFTGEVDVENSSLLREELEPILGWQMRSNGDDDKLSIGGTSAKQPACRLTGSVVRIPIGVNVNGRQN